MAQLEQGLLHDTPLRTTHLSIVQNLLFQTRGHGYNPENVTWSLILGDLSRTNLLLSNFIVWVLISHHSVRHMVGTLLSLSDFFLTILVHRDPYIL